jgi:hypothetical protein
VATVFAALAQLVKELLHHKHGEPAQLSQQQVAKLRGDATKALQSLDKRLQRPYRAARSGRPPGDKSAEAG